MNDMERQLNWESDMISRGVHRFRAQQSQAEKSRGHETSAGSRLLRSYVLGISDHIKEYLARRERRSKYAKLLDTLDVDKISMFALRQIIQTIFDSDAPIVKICSRIGRACEDELRFVHFQTEYKEYYDSLIRDFERKNTTSYSHKRRVLINKGADKGLEWRDWTDEVTFGAGALVVKLLLESCDLVEKSIVRNGKKTVAFLRPTDACVEWIKKHDAVMELTSPDRMPCLIEPADWVNYQDGGYYTPELRTITPMIKMKDLRGKRHALYRDAELASVQTAINGLQRTAWQINTRVYETLHTVWSKNLGCGLPRAEPYEFPDCPLAPGEKPLDIKDVSKQEAFEEWKAVTRELHTMERERRAKNLSIIRSMRMAKEMSTIPEFWYVYQCDFRGRVYCSSAGLSPQGEDTAKGLLQFGRGKALGSDEGVNYFLINGANKFGFDKGNYQERITFITDRATDWQLVAADPIRHRELWAEADKPYQFLAWCFEFSDYVELSNGHEYVSYLPVGLDGTCNGLQHFSAMLRDEIGGAAVNLVPADKPQDIYQTVADVCTDKLNVIVTSNEDDHAARNWLRSFDQNVMPRKLSKKPVMTLPYGSTQRACTDSIYQWAFTEKRDKFHKNTIFKHSIYLTPLLWGSIGEVVVAARAAMDWLQECSGILAKENHPLLYTSPLGFPVLQSTMKIKTKRIRTQIAGDLKITLASRTNQLDARKQKQGSSPNFVHHIDACHMMMTILACMDVGIADFAMIHDDFGTHACDAAKMQKAIRETFVKLYTDNDVLLNFKRVHEERYDIELPDLPPIGSLDISVVLQSDYFFG